MRRLVLWGPKQSLKGLPAEDHRLMAYPASGSSVWGDNKRGRGRSITALPH